jgi:tetratricopeptide (TPR) repeat protein
MDTDLNMKMQFQLQLQNPIPKWCLALLVWTWVLMAAAPIPRAGAEALVPPHDPRQTIAYWKPHVIAPEADRLVAEAQAVFQVLLRAWDRARLEPCLYVVTDAAGAWAASLADGSILLTRSALDTIMGMEMDRRTHLLAFVLAHELAHQRADDLWHQRFFRLIGGHDPEMRRQIATELQLDDEVLAHMAEKEAQADHDGLLLMASVGFDPYRILDDRDFFTTWIETLWQGTCSAAEGNTALAAACSEAQSRALRARAQLAAVAAQTTVYTMGVQAFVAGQYQAARHYFGVYGRNYPSRAVLTAIAMTHFCEALRIHQRLRHQGALEAPAFYYPVLLDASPLSAAETGEAAITKRSDRKTVLDAQKRRLQASLDRAAGLLEKAIRLAPDHPSTYLLLASTYLLGGNTFMAKGIVQGKYLPRFGSDPAAELILAMTTALEGHHGSAQNDFERVIAQLQTKTASSAAHLPEDLLTYTAHHNSAVLAEYMGQAEASRRRWQQFAEAAKTGGSSLLFRIALNHLHIPPQRRQPLNNAPHIAGVRLGDRFPSTTASADTTTENDHRYRSDPLWIEGEPFQVWRHAQGLRLVADPGGRVIGAWQDAGGGAPGEAVLDGRIAMGDPADRPMKALGVPDRRLHLTAGEYWAYDAYGIALRIEKRQVAGWFLYRSQGE